MSRALDLAERGRAAASPNPLVGACVVRRGRLIAEGWHERFGGPHAEVHALDRAGLRARGATLYVTLEPCSTWGKTPPCTEAVIRSGVSRVVVAAADPNPLHAGRGIRGLRKAGVRVEVGAGAARAKRQNAYFRKWILKRIPFVTLKMAQSLDGKIATAAGESRWITSAVSRRFVQKLRRESDAILVGRNTVICDNPRLSLRSGAGGENGKPWRVVFDAGLKLPNRSRVFGGDQVTVRVVRWADLRDRRREKSRGILLAVRERDGRFDVKDLLRQLGAMGIARLLVEGGGETAWSFLSAGCVDKIFWFVAPVLIGGRGAKTSVEGEGFARLADSLRYKMTVTSVGRDWMFEGER
jgi:diaminohydroxyphosphoribosylaminopyrimidine deaminase/5-amino-6-(5-phosphoribosylamino)uracil reductase